MADIIQLLPDSIANQIAAGEVIQRPASIVKELLENAIDAGATEIKLIIKEAGKALVQVIDNGSGMSETDARMCFERHATSKIRAAQDLFSIRSMGFRGEAMASIAAVAHVEMRTRLHSEELGTELIIEGSKVKSQGVCQCVVGTNLSVKNLFYNVPARRNFLKSNTVEMRHILDEFQRIALAHSNIFFSLHHNGQEIFHLAPGNLRQRVVAIFGNTSNKKLVPVQEETDALKLDGFIGKPEFARKTRGEQYFFVNKRFIKSGYLHHALLSAYENLLQKDTHPFYVIFIEIDPAQIDINVHPTKQEIKFEDERLVYNYLRVAVRHGLGQYSITPTLDFDAERSISPAVMSQTPNRYTKEDIASGMTNFSSKGNAPRNTDSFDQQRQSNNLQNWQKLYDGLDDSGETNNDIDSENEQPMTIKSKWSSVENELDDEANTFSMVRKEPYQLHASYIVSQIKSGYMLIDQQAAHERILYERYLTILEEKQALTQKELFPRTLSLSPIDAEVLRELMPQMTALGFDIQGFGTNSFVLNGIPANLTNGLDEQKVIESLIEQYKENISLKLDARENMARSMARSASIRRGQNMTIVEMQELIDQLFACAVPYKNPSGRNCFLTFELDELERKFSA